MPAFEKHITRSESVQRGSKKLTISNNAVERLSSNDSLVWEKELNAAECFVLFATENNFVKSNGQVRSGA